MGNLYDFLVNECVDNVSVNYEGKKDTVTVNDSKFVIGGENLRLYNIIFNYCVFHKVNFSYVDFNEVCFNKCIFIDCTFTGCTICESQLIDTKIDGIKLLNCSAFMNKYNNININNLCVENYIEFESHFESIIVDNLNVKSINIANMGVKNCNASNIKVKSSYLSDISLFDSVLEKISVAYTTIHGGECVNSCIREVLLNNTIIDFPNINHSELYYENIDNSSTINFWNCQFSKINDEEID